MPGALLGAVIDANVLYQRYPRNLVVWLAVEQSFRMVVSERIFAEAREHLVKRNLNVHNEPRNDTVDRIIDLIRIELDAGAGTVVGEDDVANREATLKAHDPDDRHVLAAAAATGADLIVTHDERGFDKAECERHGVAVVSLDEFLMRVAGSSAEDAIVTALTQCARYPPNSLADLLDIIATFAPRFAEWARPRAS